MTDTHRGPAPLDDCSALQRDLLLLLVADGPLSGAELLDAVNLTYEVPPNRVTRSKLYVHLDELVAAGLLRKRSRDGRTNEYLLTVRGRRRIEAHADWMGACLEA